jgi:hypothetical protein
MEEEPASEEEDDTIQVDALLHSAEETLTSTI